MMFHMQGASNNSCSLLAVVCNRRSEDKLGHHDLEDCLSYPFPELSSSGCLEVRTLTSPSVDIFRRTLESFRPGVVYLRGEQLHDGDAGSLKWGDSELSTADAISELFSSTMPTTVYLEICNGEELAEAIHSKGVPFVIFWRNSFSRYAACHFRHALFSVFQSSPSHTWDAFQLAHASFRLYCARSNLVLPSNSEKLGSKLGPCLLGDPPSIDVALPEVEADNEEYDYENNLSAVKIHDDDVSLRFLVCGVPCLVDACLLGCLEDGLNALLSIEVRGSKLHNRSSAAPPPLQAGTFSRGVVTMRCDITTATSAHISLLVSGSAQSCFVDQLLEGHIKKEVTERSQLVHAVPTSEENKVLPFQPHKSASIACGATVFEVSMKVPSWAVQVLRQLAPEASYRNFVALGIASIQGLAVASFQKDDAERLLFFCTRQSNGFDVQSSVPISAPSWLKAPAPSRKRTWFQGSIPCSQSGRIPEDHAAEKMLGRENKKPRLWNGVFISKAPVRQKLRVAAMRPIPHKPLCRLTTFSGMVDMEGHDGVQVKASFQVPSVKHNVAGSNPAPYRKSTSHSHQAKQQILSLNPIPLKKHGCDRAPIYSCSEEEFLRDVMQFLIHRGHTRLVPHGGLAEFPDAILNSKRLDLYNLYREVVSRGGFHVGNGINWKGQVFSKMRNYTATNKMTGVGNTLKRHYEAFLLEYELAHDDVDGECCLLCHSGISVNLDSSAAGDWVNCGICGEWAHFGCDRRQGLGAFKDYAKTDGLEYICPQCSVTNFKKKSKPLNGFSEGMTCS